MSRTRQPMGSTSFQTTTESSQDSTAHLPTLRLRAEATPTETDTSEATSSSRRIRWSEDVVDNEGMGKKSSKGMEQFYLFHLFYLFDFNPPNSFPRNQQQSNRHQYAASTTKPDQWEKVAQKNRHPAHPRATARAKTTVAQPESTGLATHTHTTEGGIPTASTSMHQGVVPKIANLNRNARAGSRVRMHMRRCPSHRGIKIKINIMRGVLDLAFEGVFLSGKDMRGKVELSKSWV